jgi:hypothetical protein
VEPGAPPRGPLAGVGDGRSYGSAREKRKTRVATPGDNRRCGSPSLRMEEGHASAGEGRGWGDGAIYIYIYIYIYINKSFCKII